MNVHCFSAAYFTIPPSGSLVELDVDVVHTACMSVLRLAGCRAVFTGNNVM